MAGIFKDKGLVIREYPAGESDKRLTLLLFERGRVNVFAKGAAGPKSKFHQSAALFAFSDFVIYQGANFMSLNQANLVTNFYGLQRDFEKLCLASHVLELADMMILPEMPCQNELRLIYLTLSKLAKTDYPSRLAAVVFEFKFMQMAGFYPVTGRCFGCSKSISNFSDGCYFTNTGLACENCAKDLPKTKISAPAAQALTWILAAETQNLFALNLAPGPTMELAKALDLFRRQVLDKAPKSLELLT